MKAILKKTNIGLLLIISLLSFNSCLHNKFEEPEKEIIPEGKIYTIQDLYRISDSLENIGGSGATYKFAEDCSVFGVISMDDKSGNIYKSAFVQDGTHAINLHLLSSGGLYEGDSIRIYLKGLILGKYSGMLQLDSVNADKNVIKLATNKDVIPQVVTIPEISIYDAIIGRPYLGEIVEIKNVQFIESDLGKTYANKEDKITENRTIEDEMGNKIIVRTSGYASFADNPIPEGRGNIIALASIYNNEWQLYIRKIGEVKFNKRRFGDYDTVMYVGFNDIENQQPLNTPDWANITERGTRLWLGNNNGSNGSVKIESDTNEESTSWLILPKTTLSSALLKFKTRAGLLSGATLEVFISSDYLEDGMPQNASWTKLDANIGTATINSFGEWTESGTINLSEYIGEYYIAFKYNSEINQKGIFYLDDILIFSE